MRKIIYILVLSLLAVTCGAIDTAIASDEHKNVVVKEEPKKLAVKEPAKVVVKEPKKKAVKEPAKVVVKEPKKLAVKEPAKREKFDRGITMQTFMPKGMWFFGGNISYSQHNNEDFQMFGVLKDFTSRGYTFAIRPLAGYTFANNMAAGVAFTYNRTMLQVDDLTLGLGDDLSFGLSDIYNIEHVYTGTVFFRSYINIGNSRRFALISDVKLQFGGGQGKQLNGKGEQMTGTYTKIYELGLILSPGVAVFVNDFTSIEASVGVLGYKYKRTEQITNQVYQGSRQTSGADFKIDIFSIALGITFYL